MAEQPALAAALDLRAVGELARLAEIVDDRGAEQQVAVQARVQRAQLQRERGDRDRVLEQAAEVGVVAGAGAGGRGPGEAPAAARGSVHGARRICARSALSSSSASQQRLQRRVVDLAREVLEEAFELVEVAVGDRQEARRVGLGALGARRSLRSSTCSSLAEALRRARARARARPARSARRAGRRRGTRARAIAPAAVAQLDRQVGRAGARDQALLARAGEHAVDLLAGAQRGDGLSLARRRRRWRRRHRPMMYGDSDAAPDLGPPSGRPAGPGDGVRLQGLERRRRRRVQRALVPGLRARRARFARIDPEEFYDFQANRPVHPLRRAAEREIVWPTVEIFEAPAPRAPRDLVLVQGVEPSMRWRAFSAHLVDLAEALGVQLVVSLGALLGDVPHTRPVAMTGHASDAALLERLGIPASSYEGPTGIVGVLHTRLRAGGAAVGEPVGERPALRRRGHQPEGGARAAAQGRSAVGVSVDVSELESAAADYERQVGLAVQSDPDIQAFVERLEQAADSEEQSAPEDVPSGDMLAREFQRFLRQRGRESR